jgi:hypothetical protein
MWWVAWRQHRVQVMVALVVMVVVAIGLLVFQLVLVGRLHAAGCTVLTDESQCNARLFPLVASAYDEGTWRILRAALVATPVVLGVFLGAPLFPREFDQRTEVFALTQSVGRLRWWATKIAVVGVPLVAGLLGLGFLTQWCDGTTWFTARGAMDDGTFQVRSIMPAAFGLLALAIAVTAGIVVRSLVGSLVAGLIAAAGVVVLLAFPLRSHLLPTSRDITPVDAVAASPTAMPDPVGAYDPGSLYLASGLLDANGDPISFNAISALCDPSMPPMPEGNPDQQEMDSYNDKYNKAFDECRRDNGITRNYIDYVPASMLWPMRGVVTGICVLLAALFLAAGAFRLRAAPRHSR